MGIVKLGRIEGIPYSLSRWTDVPGAKWAWMRSSFSEGKMVAFDPRTAVPSEWSLRPEDTLGLVWWTKDPTNLLKDYNLIKPYRNQFHVTITGWHEAEKGVPPFPHVCSQVRELAGLATGDEGVIWRFSPVPLVRDVLGKFEAIAELLNGAVKDVYLSFLQSNDLMPETRDRDERIETMVGLAAIGARFGMRVHLCNEDRTLSKVADLPPNLDASVCAKPEFWAQPGLGRSPSEGCGCVLMADPFTINETCTFGCHYCLDPSTPVLYSDMVWRPIGEAKVGDVLVGFDEFSVRGGRSRKMRETIIEAVTVSKQPTIRLITNQSDVITTANHGWINDRGKWMSTRTLWGQGPERTKLRQIGQTKDLPFTEPYKLGYLAGMTKGDGTFRYEPGQGTSRRGFPQAYWRVALNDEEPLGRLVAYLASFGVEANIRLFNGRSASDPYPMSKVEIRALGRLHRIHELLTTAPEHPDYWRGFLAGFYDAEGSMGGSLRVSQKDRTVLRQVGDYARKFGFDLYVEPHSDGRNVGTSRLRGALRERMRFISTIRPALARKSPEWLGSSFETDDDPVMHKEKGSVREVVDIQTSTHTFFAAGLATHNCYAADLTLSEKKRNTTRGLPIVR